MIISGAAYLKNGRNRANWVTSMKFGLRIVFDAAKKTGRRAIADSARGYHGNCFNLRKHVSKIPCY